MCRPSVDEQLFPRLAVRAEHLRHDVHERQVRVGGAYCRTSAFAPLICSIHGNRRMLGLIEMKTICVVGQRRVHLPFERREVARDLCGRVIGLDVVVAGVEHHHPWLMRNHDAVRIPRRVGAPATRRIRD